MSTIEKDRILIDFYFNITYTCDTIKYNFKLIINLYL